MIQQSTFSITTGKHSERYQLVIIISYCSQQSIRTKHMHLFAVYSSHSSAHKAPPTIKAKSTDWFAVGICSLFATWTQPPPARIFAHAQTVRVLARCVALLIRKSNIGGIDASAFGTIQRALRPMSHRPVHNMVWDP